MNPIKSKMRLTYLSVLCALPLGLGVSPLLSAEEIEDPLSHLQPLTGHTPVIGDVSDFVKDQTALEALGKALFWDLQAGSDGMACASCHFKAGADARIVNQFNKGSMDGTFGGLRDVMGVEYPSPSFTHGKFASGATAGSNYEAKPSDFPLHQLEDENDRDSDIVYTTDDTFGSQGTFARIQNGELVTGGGFIEHCDQIGNEVLAVRQTTTRNAPTAINAAFNHRNFWDGRANNIFNGVDPFGRRSENARILKFDNGSTSLVEVEIENASAASQAVGPLLSTAEMSCNDRQFPQVGRKLADRYALAQQEVAHTDSLLGDIRALPKGLRQTYRTMVENAFHDKWWQDSNTYRQDNSSGDPVLVADPDGFTQFELNFSLFWGLSIQAYEALLVSDQTRYDDFLNGDSSALTSLEQEGLAVFVGDGKCVSCHAGPLLTKAAQQHLIPEDQEEGLVERMHMGNNDIANYDNGFYNIGVTPSVFDIGLGADDPWGNALSFTKQWLDLIQNGNDPKDPFQVDVCTFEALITQDPDCGLALLLNNPSVANAERPAVDGAFKTSTLRNVGLTAPFFHNGGYATLEGSVTFYNRGGNVRSLSGGEDTSGLGPYRSNLDPDIRQLNLSDHQQKALTAFMLALTDDRVACEQAPFDHPELLLPTGALDQDLVNIAESFDDVLGMMVADRFNDDYIIRLPATGAAGLAELSRTCHPNTGSVFNYYAQSIVETSQGVVIKPLNTGNGHFISADSYPHIIAAYTHRDLSGTDLNGHDQIYGHNQGDGLSGSRGNDRMWGRAGNDHLNGERGADRLHGEQGEDWLYGGNGRDWLSGGEDDDKLFGGSGHDELFGGPGMDHLDGGNGRDTLDGGADDDSMTGGNGDDEFVINGNDQILDFESGEDRIRLGSTVNVSIDGADLLLTNPITGDSVRLVNTSTISPSDLIGASMINGI